MLRNVHRVNFPISAASFRRRCLPLDCFVRPPRIWTQICRCSAAVRLNMGKKKRSMATALYHEWLKAFTPGDPHHIQGWWRRVLHLLSSTLHLAAPLPSHRCASLSQSASSCMLKCTRSARFFTRSSATQQSPLFTTNQILNVK